MNPCPECGALDNTCEARFHECLAKEFEDSAYGAVHHLTCVLQREQISAQILGEHISELATPEARRSPDLILSARRLGLRRVLTLKEQVSEDVGVHYNHGRPSSLNRLISSSVSV